MYQCTCDMVQDMNNLLICFFFVQKLQKSRRLTIANASDYSIPITEIEE